MATQSSILVWKIPQREEPGRLQSLRSKESDTTEQLNTTYIHIYACLCSVASVMSTLCYPTDYSLPGFSVHGISPARILKWVAIWLLSQAMRVTLFL